MNNELSLNDIRRRNLMGFITDKAFKSVNAFAKEYGLFTSNLSLILNGSRDFTDKLAKNIENKLNLPDGYLSRPNQLTAGFYFIPNFKIEVDNDCKYSLTRDKTELRIDKELLSLDGRELSNIISFSTQSKLDRSPLVGDLLENTYLLFDKSDVIPVDKKIYLIQYDHKILLRKYSILDHVGVFTSNFEKIFVRIPANEKIKVLGRLIGEAIGLITH